MVPLVSSRGLRVPADRPTAPSGGRAGRAFGRHGPKYQIRVRLTFVPQSSWTEIPNPSAVNFRSRIRILHVPLSVDPHNRSMGRTDRPGLQGSGMSVLRPASVSQDTGGER